MDYQAISLVCGTRQYQESAIRKTGALAATDSRI